MLTEGGVRHRLDTILVSVSRFSVHVDGEETFCVPEGNGVISLNFHSTVGVISHSGHSKVDNVVHPKSMIHPLSFWCK